MTYSGTMHKLHNLYTVMFNLLPVLALVFKEKNKFVNLFSVDASNQKSNIKVKKCLCVIDRYLKSVCL